jgi:hypothetical protein
LGILTDNQDYRAVAHHQSTACTGHKRLYHLTRREFSPFPIIHGYVPTSAGLEDLRSTLGLTAIF